MAVVEDFAGNIDDSDEAIESVRVFVYKVFGEVEEFLAKNEGKLTAE